MNTQNIKTLVFLVILVIVSSSCKKYLDVKSNQSYSTPSTLQDLQALLDDPYSGRRGMRMTQTSSDEYSIPFTYWQRIGKETKDGYIWKDDLNDLSDWNNQYTNILTVNTVLDNLQRISESVNPAKYNEIRGAALFLRTHCFYQLAQVFCPQYDSTTSTNDLGIVLRLDSDFNKPSRRSTVEQTYSQIVIDLEIAADLLPVTPAYKSRPSKPAAYALLARAYLQMNKFDKAKEWADKCLQLYNMIIDFNDTKEIDTAWLEPYLHQHINNKEVLWYQNEDGSPTVSDQSSVDSNLYKLYKPNDLRKVAFFEKNGQNSYWFHGSYNGSYQLGNFVGLSTPEVYLIRAESNVRLGNKVSALEDLNSLLEKRYRKGTFAPVQASSWSELLSIILNERRKELAFRGLRWSDLRRLNKELDRAVTLRRVLNGQLYELLPNDHRYTLLIPREVMQLSSLEQNSR